MNVNIYAKIHITAMNVYICLNIMFWREIVKNEGGNDETNVRFPYREKDEAAFAFSKSCACSCSF